MNILTKPFLALAAIAIITLTFLYLPQNPAETPLQATITPKASTSTLSPTPEPAQTTSNSKTDETLVTSPNVPGIKLPQGFKIEVFAEGLTGNIAPFPGAQPGPRFMLWNNNTLFVSIISQGTVVALKDENKDWKADLKTTITTGLNKPHGLEYFENWLYIAEEHRVIRLKDADGDSIPDSETVEIVIEKLPSQGHHFTRTIKIHQDKLYVSVGSSCNACFEEDPHRAAIIECDTDGSNCEVYATGLRNTVGFIFHEGKMYSTDNGRDLIGNDLPPDEINVIEKGGDYGWPTCFGKNVLDTNFDKNTYIKNPCEDKKPSFVDLQAHSAPLGLAVYDGEMFPNEYQGELFVAYHGSWNREPPTGYKIVRINLDDLTVKDFATGWLKGTSVSGRPVDLIVALDGSMLASDDKTGKIYRISYDEN